MDDLQRINLVNQLLPQTQCGLCGHVLGCLPYATSIVNNGEAANLCVPGGQVVADQIASVLSRPQLPVTPSDWPIGADGRPQRILAVINEAQCIGCTKCLDVCPVDAIVGGPKLMHTVITDICTGCELCIPPCPVDCIDLVDNPHTPTPKQQSDIQNTLKTRYEQHLKRLQKKAAQNLSPMLSGVVSKRVEALTAAANITDEPNDLQPQQSSPALLQDFAQKPKNTLLKSIALKSQIGKLQRQQQHTFSAQTESQIAQLTLELRQLEGKA